MFLEGDASIEGNRKFNSSCNTNTEKENVIVMLRSVKMKSIWITIVLDTRGRGGGGGGSNTMADYCAQGSFQIRPSESLNVCE